LVVETEITSNTCKLSLDDINITQVSEAIRQLSTIGIDIPFFRTTFSPSLPDFKREHDKFQWNQNIFQFERDGVQVEANEQAWFSQDDHKLALKDYSDLNE